jgi:GntR family transcriptional regulator / MocR family aminotransferase
MLIVRSAPDSRTVLRDLHAQLKAAILEGRLTAGIRLPASRVLAATLGVSRNTAVAAYDMLLSEGYITAKAGAGTFVANTVRASQRTPRTQAGNAVDARLNATSRAVARMPPSQAATVPQFDFPLGVPDTTLLRLDIWNRISARCLRALPHSALAYGPAEGQPSLRGAIAGHASFTRAVACSANDVVVSNGAQQAFDLLARTLVTPGKTRVALENPGYGPVCAAFVAAGARIVRIPVDVHGMQVHRLPEHVHIVCVSPSHQFPLGCVLSAQRRIALLDYARTHRAVIVEDDYDGEFRYGARPLDALQTLDREQCVFFVGTFSKSLFPALRIGYIVAPPWAQRALVATKTHTDRQSNVLAQETLAAFITQGHLARHVRKMQGIYSSRRQRLLDSLRADFAPWLSPVPSAAGLHLAALTAPAINAEALIARALSADVGVGSLNQYGHGRATPQGLLFGFGAIDEAKINAGMKRFRSMLREEVTGSP